MHKKSLEINYEEYSSKEELEVQDKVLVERAIEATKTSYSPYSKFCVGAAVLLSNGEIVSASNQENAAYPSGLCAERVALFYAHAKYPNESVKSLAITAFFNGEQTDTPTYPCGACRQVIAESELRAGDSIKVIIAGKYKIHKVIDVKSLLPFTFNNLPK